MSPKLSIITVNLNNAVGLHETIKSVIGQSFSDFEYIIIDGGSTDGSVGIIKEFSDKLTYWISEPDNGIYNAMNKGILKATGEYSLFLNSGDALMEPEILKSISQYWVGKFDLVCGSACHWRDNKLNIKNPLDDLRMSKIYKRTLPHQACFIKTKLFQEVGFYNEENKIVSDWEFFVNCAKQGVSYLPLDQMVTLMEPPNISSDYSQLHALHIKEREDRRLHLFVNYIDDLEELFSFRNRKFSVMIKKVFKFFSVRRLVHLIKKQFSLLFY